jgi:hypothetical protein
MDVGRIKGFGLCYGHNPLLVQAYKKFHGARYCRAGLCELAILPDLRDK